MKVIRVIEKEISCCQECPYYSESGMERMMVCNHPKWNDKSLPDYPYAGCIISWNWNKSRAYQRKHNPDSGFPEKCPLVP